MHPSRPIRTRSFVGLVAPFVLCVVGLTATGSAQATDATAPSSAGSQSSIPTLQTLDQSVRVQDYTAIQLRRFRSPQANVVTVREKLEVDANGTQRPTFALTFLGVEGEAAGSQVSLEWQQVYARFAPQLYAHGSFRIRDLTAATTNYSIHDFGSVVRANRSARRMVVFPATLDKAIWVVDVDVQTDVPLYAAEFDVHLNLLSEVETIAFTDTVTPLASAVTAPTPLPSFAAASAAMGHPAEIVEPTVAVTNEYSLDRIEVHNDPLNGQWKLTMTYTDGIDQFMVVQAPGTQDLFAGLPGQGQGGNVIGRFRDPAMSVLLFWESGVSFHVAGRGALKRLDGLAQAIYLQALSSH